MRGVWFLVGGTVAFPSYRYHVPNGDRVPCYDGATGCRSGDAQRNQPETACFGLGHPSCWGHAKPLNPFGQAWQAADFVWTESLCKADSDGDGFTNGQELGDPCCQWGAWDVPSSYMASHTPSHPGDSRSTLPENFEAPACGSGDSVPGNLKPAQEIPELGGYNPGETAKSMDFVISSYEIPAKPTTYVDIGFNVNLSAFSENQTVMHIVDGEVILDQPKFLHHFVIMGCRQPFAPEDHGKVMAGGMRESCGSMLGTWAPGQPILQQPRFSGLAFGPGAALMAFLVQVHFTNDNSTVGVVSRDGFRIHYTDSLRQFEASQATVSALGSNPSMVIPPGEARFFVTRQCEVSDVGCGDMSSGILREMTDGQVDSCESVTALCATQPQLLAVCPETCGACPNSTSEDGWDAPGRLLTAWFHGHLLAREMYAELIRGKETSDIWMERVWHFDDQNNINLMAHDIRVRPGDKIQATCVFDSTSRSRATQMGVDTVDEMCWAQFGLVKQRGDPSMFGFTCVDGDWWAGPLDEGDDVRGLHSGQHALGETRYQWENGNAVQGGPRLVNKEWQAHLVDAVFQTLDSTRDDKLQREEMCFLVHYMLPTDPFVFDRTAFEKWCDMFGADCVVEGGLSKADVESVLKDPVHAHWSLVQVPSILDRLSETSSPDLVCPAGWALLEGQCLSQQRVAHGAIKSYEDAFAECSNFSWGGVPATLPLTTSEALHNAVFDLTPISIDLSQDQTNSCAWLAAREQADQPTVQAVSTAIQQLQAAVIQIAGGGNLTEIAAGVMPSVVAAVRLAGVDHVTSQVTDLLIEMSAQQQRQVEATMTAAVETALVAAIQQGLPFLASGDRAGAEASLASAVPALTEAVQATSKDFVMKAAANVTEAALKSIGQEASVGLLQPSIDALVEAAADAVTNEAAAEKAAAEAAVAPSVTSAISDAVQALVALGAGATPEQQLAALTAAVPALVGGISTTSKDFVASTAAAAATAALEAMSLGVMDSQLQPQITALVDTAADLAEAQKPPTLDVLVLDLVRNAASLTDFVPNVPTFAWANGASISGFLGWSENDPPRIPETGYLRPVAMFNDATWRAVSGEEEVLCTYVCQVPAADPADITPAQTEPACVRPTPTTVTSDSSRLVAAAVLLGVVAAWA
mmetsp:Transcript_26229/g.67724  ORF Transcript_26229/g.67724 Transcript_26229/m.67724 type:complete len:1149 (+) Transcript_26229:60-3506(+)